MDFTKKILILFVIILFTYIVWHLLMTRLEVRKELNLESFSLFGTTLDNELTNVENKSLQIAIRPVNPQYANLPLREYCIKSSYNSALTGNYINLDMLQYVINRGCRFLDFEVFYINDDTNTSSTVDKHKPMVAYSTDSTFMTLSCENSILLDNVLSSAAAMAFSPPCPNYQDPLFINLRIKSNDKRVYHAVAKSIDTTIYPKMYIDRSDPKKNPYPAIKITNDTKLTDIMGNIIISIDKTIDRGYKDNLTSDYNIKDYTNIESGSEELNLVRYSDLMNQCIFPINILNDNMRTSIKTMKMAVPDLISTNTLNPDINDFILKYGCQDVFYRFYVNDKQLQNYENFFNDNKSAFVTLANAITYFQKLQ